MSWIFFGVGGSPVFLILQNVWCSDENKLSGFNFRKFYMVARFLQQNILKG